MNLMTKVRIFMHYFKIKATEYVLKSIVILNKSTYIQEEFKLLSKESKENLNFKMLTSMTKKKSETPKSVFLIYKK